MTRHSAPRPQRSLARRAVAATAGLLMAVTGAGLAAVTTATNAEAATANLPFDLVSTNGPKMVFAHYFTPYPESLDNADPSNDYYARNYLNPTGESGAHAAYGGLLRDRPLTHAALTSSTWLVDNMKDEIRQAQAAGINGFIVDLMVNPATSTNTNVKNAQANLMTAADSFTNFSVMLMPDMTSGLGTLTATDLAAVVNTYATHKSAYRLADGRLVVSPFKAEGHTAAWWTDFMNIMSTTYGTQVAFVPCFLNEGANETAFAPISYGMSEWGNRNPAGNDPSATGTQRTKINRVHGLGKIWMQPVSVQDERPNQAIYDEAQNTQNLRNTWKIAIDSQSEWVQLVTWNDYSEGAQVAPSAEHGWTFTDLSAFYGQWFRTGAMPTIARDAVYLTHREQPYAATPTFAETSLMKLRAGSSAARDTVEALSILTAPATVSVTVGGTTTSCAAPAGVSVCTVPLATGRAAVAVDRNGAIVASVATKQTITATPYVQDLQYVGAGSLREGPADPALLGVIATPTPTPTATTATPTPTPTPTVTTASPTPTATTASPTPTASGATTTVALTPVADSWVNSAAAATVYGTGNYLTSRGSTAAVSYLRFAIPAAPAGMQITGASLGFTTTSDPLATSTDTHPVRIGSDAWDEATLTWNNHPALGTTTLGSLPAAPAVSTRYAATLDAAALDAAVPAAGGTVTLTVQGSATDGVFFFSREGTTASTRPVLTLTYGAAAADTTAPSAPGAPVATVAAGDVSLTWAAATDNVGVTEYDVYRSDVAGTAPSAGMLVATTTGTTWVDSATPIGTWYYRVVAGDAAGNSSASSAETAVLVPDVTAPTPGVLTSTVSAYDVALGWTAATDDVAVTGYRVYRSTTAFVPSAATLIGTTTGLTFVDTARPVGTSYYAVVAVDAAGNASSAATASAAVLDVTAPAAPVADVSVATGTATVTWTAASDNVATTAYDVYRSGAPFAPSAATLVGTTSGLQLVDAGLTMGSWYYAVVAVDAAGNRSAASALVSTTVGDVTAPTAPEVTASAVAGDVTVAWAGASDDVAVVAYEVYRSATPSGSAALVGTTTATELVDAGRTAGSWYYTVVALDAAGNASTPSAPAVADVADVTAPSTPVVTATATGGAVTLAWPASNDDVAVTGYRVSRLVGDVATQVGDVTGLAFTETVADGTWTYLVQAHDAAGNLSTAGAATITVATPVVTVVRPSADTWVNANSTTKNYGGTTTLATRGTPAAVSYLKFVVPAAPAGHTLQSIVLSFRTTSTSGSGSANAQYARVTTDGWTEGSLTWNNRPTASGTLLGSISSANALSTTYKVTLNAATLLASKTVGGNVNVALTSAGNDNLAIYSAQYATSAYAPTLTFTWK